MVTKDAFRLLIIMTVAGIIIKFMDAMMLMIIAQSIKQWSESLADGILLFDTFISIVLILVIGLVFMRKLEKKKIVKLVVVVIVYSFLVLGIQQVYIKTGPYSLLYSQLFIPGNIFAFISAWIIRIEGTSIYFGIFLAYLAPMIFVLFGQSEKEMI